MRPWFAGLLHRNLVRRFVLREDAVTMEEGSLNFVLPRGELAALTSALLWAIAASLYSRAGTSVPPLSLNLLKGAIAIAAILATVALRSLPPSDLSFRSAALLLASGVVGIGIGDTAFLTSLNYLGARRALLLETLAPPLSALLALIFLQEILSPVAWGGILIVLLGVGWTVAERTPGTAIEASQFWRGLAWAFVAELSQASGAVLSRAVLANAEVTALTGSLWRLSGGTAAALIWLLLRPSSRLRPWRLSPRTLLAITVAALLGTYLGIWLQQVAFKFSPTGIAQTLLATSPLFVLPIVAIAGERPSYRAMLGAAIAVSGITLLFRG